MWTEHPPSCLFPGCKTQGGHLENKTPNETKYPFLVFQGKPLKGPELMNKTPYKEEANCWGSENGYWELTIIATHYLSLVPEKQFSFSNISVPVKLRKRRIQIPPKGVSLKKFTSSTATGIYGFFFNSCSLIYLFLGSQGRFIYLSFEHFKQIPAL